MPQKLWEMWGLPRPRTQRPRGALRLLHNQAGSPELSNWGAKEWIPSREIRLALALWSLGDWRLQGPFLNWDGILWTQVAAGDLECPLKGD